MADRTPNRLINEKSPYLLQHAHNPVDWFPWGEDAFRKAQTEDKSVFLSIGYSTCHWCHVMERESFEDPEIAEILNKHFVAVKVDREERPDIDHVYMTAVSSLTGSGGWPLSVFLTPDRKPFYGGTYFPPRARWNMPGFRELLLSIASGWKSRREQILRSGEEIAASLKEHMEGRPAEPAGLAPSLLETAYERLSKNYDPEYGGFGQAPKFPMGHTLSFLLRHWYRTGHNKALDMAEHTLLSMARGGIHDHLGGGFHRYSTDPEWQVPHFEKMLYDQAILIRAFLEAFQATGREEFASVARSAMDYVLRDLRDREGGFYSAEDADSLDPGAPSAPGGEGLHEKKEGAFYLWPAGEIAGLLAERDRDVFFYHYGIAPGGNARYDPHGEFSGKNILYETGSLEQTARQFRMDPAETAALLREARQKLLVARGRRPRPHLDDKVLTDWNGLMISALSFGSLVLKEDRYLSAARDAADFILERLVAPDGRLMHRYRDGQTVVPGNLCDYAFFINGLLDLYEAAGEGRYLKKAMDLGRGLLALFSDPDRKGFFFSARTDEPLLFRYKDAYDGAIPSGNSMAALALARLDHLTFEDLWKTAAEETLGAFAGEMQVRPEAYAQMLTAFDFLLGPVQDIVLVAEKPSRDCRADIDRIFSRFLPRKSVLWCPAGDEEAFRILPRLAEYRPAFKPVTIYVCDNRVCRPPVSRWEDLAEPQKTDRNII